MYTETDKKIMLRFLERNYPVKRFKQGHKFKRAIILDNGSIFYLSDTNSHTKLKYEMVDILKQIFDCDDIVISAVLDRFLPIK